MYGMRTHGVLNMTDWTLSTYLIQFLKAAALLFAALRLLLGVLPANRNPANAKLLLYFYIIYFFFGNVSRCGNKTFTLLHFGQQCSRVKLLSLDCQWVPMDIQLFKIK